MEGGNFTISGGNSFGIARAKEIMNSKSSNESRWSVRINKMPSYDEWLVTGIATKLQRITDRSVGHDLIHNYDKKAIIFFPFGDSFGLICEGETTLQDHITKAKNGDEIHIQFRFQPKLKKFSISFVS